MATHLPSLDRFLASAAPALKTDAEFVERCALLGSGAVQLPRPLRKEQQRPIVVLGAGSVVRDGHGPAYQLAGFRRLAIFDKNLAAARSLQAAFGFEQCAPSLAEAIAVAEQHHAVLDLALPPAAFLEVLPQLPRASAALIQKPLGKTLEEAGQIYQLCAARELQAAVNLQLPFSPQIVTAFAALGAGLVGSLTGARVELALRTEWSNWEFVFSEPRIEVLLHSIHYLSLFAAYLGEPHSVESEQRGDPAHPLLKERDVCSSTRLHYQTQSGLPLVCNIVCDHLSTKPHEQWRSELILEGSQGRIVARIGDNLDYPNGVADQLLIQHAAFPAQQIPLLGNRFPWAFVATMTELQRALAEGDEPANGLALGLLTMRMTEACYQSHALGGRAVSVPPLPDTAKKG